MDSLINLDEHALLFLNGLGSTSFDNFWIWVTGKWTWVPLYIIFLYVIYKNFSLRDFIYILIFVAIGITISDQLAGIYKNGIMRLRPCHDPDLIKKMRLVTCGGPYGFFSSHASNSFFLATFLSILLKDKIKWFPYLLFSWAFLVSLSRIYLGVHFPLDIVYGAIVGTLLGGLFAALAKKAFAKNSLIV